MNRTQQRIVQSAFELFGRSGFHAVGLDQIIADAGISKQTFYNHFESKDDLVLAVLRYRHEAESAKFDQLLTEVAGRDPRDRLYAIFDALHRWFQLPEWKGCIFMRAASEFPNRNDPAHLVARDHAEATREYLQYLATLAGATDPASLATQLSLLIEGVIGLHHLSGDDRLLWEAKEISRRILDERLGAGPAASGAILQAAQSPATVQ